MSENRPGPSAPIPFGDTGPKRNLGRKKQAVDWLVMNGEIGVVYSRAIEVPGQRHGRQGRQLAFCGMRWTR